MFISNRVFVNIVIISGGLRDVSVSSVEVVIQRRGFTFWLVALEL